MAYYIRDEFYASQSWTDDARGALWMSLDVI